MSRHRIAVIELPVKRYWSMRRFIAIPDYTSNLFHPEWPFFYDVWCPELIIGIYL